MIAFKSEPTPTYTVIHPIYDVQETKLSGEGLGQMKMTKTVRNLLLILRVYLISMTLMLAFHLAQMAGFLGHIPTK